MQTDVWLKDMEIFLGCESIKIYDVKNMEEVFIDDMVKSNFLYKLKRPGSYLARSSEDDVARLESRTFICTSNEEEIDNPHCKYYKNNEYKRNINWCNSEIMKNELFDKLKNCMRGREAYLIPFVMGAINDENSILGLMITDSKYVAVNMGIMSGVDEEIINKINEGREYIKCIHSVGAEEDCIKTEENIQLKWISSKKKYICHFPEENLVCSYGSGYGGNAILSKKCVGLRMASINGYKNGWYAEHMMLISLENKKQNKKIYIAGSFPSACGKTNMAMIKSKYPEWEIKTLGDDITWLRIIDGKLYGMNPEYGFFGVAPNTSNSTNTIAMETIKENTIFTNTGLTLDDDVWWEGIGYNENEIIDWKGNTISYQNNKTQISHPNARFTVRSNQCPQYSKEDDKKWVPISAIIFGGRRNSPFVPLIRESHTFEEGVLMGATLSSEQTSAVADSLLGSLRYDPFSMLPFCGYSFSNYFFHWLNMRNKLKVVPKIYYINLFGQRDGKYIWPGFSDNIHILKWIYQRVINNISYQDSILGYLPLKSDLETYSTYDSDEFKEFWINQLLKDKEYLLSVKSPTILVDIVSSMYSSFKN